jgi:hypothetical protein
VEGRGGSAGGKRRLVDELWCSHGEGRQLEVEGEADRWGRAVGVWEREGRELG